MNTASDFNNSFNYSVISQKKLLIVVTSIIMLRKKHSAIYPVILETF